MIKQFNQEDAKQLTKEDIKRIKDFDEKFDDPECPTSNEEELSKMIRFTGPESLAKAKAMWFKPRKKTVTIRLDIDVIEKYKSLGKGYQTKMNADLRKAVGL